MRLTLVDGTIKWRIMLNLHTLTRHLFLKSLFHTCTPDIPKILLLLVYGDYIEQVWDKLPEHVKADSEIRTYRRYDEHYNQLWQRMHINGAAPKITEIANVDVGRRSAKMINALPFELHILGYQFCVPGTRLTKWLARGNAGINPLDAAYREHDITYSHRNNLTDRHAADKVLADKVLPQEIRLWAREPPLLSFGQRWKLRPRSAWAWN